MDKDTENKDVENTNPDSSAPIDGADDSVPPNNEEHEEIDDLDLDLDLENDDIEDEINLNEDEYNLDEDLSENINFEDDDPFAINDASQDDERNAVAAAGAGMAGKKPNMLVTAAITGVIVIAVVYYSFFNKSSDSEPNTSSEASEINAATNSEPKLPSMEKKAEQMEANFDNATNSNSSSNAKAIEKDNNEWAKAEEKMLKDISKEPEKVSASVEEVLDKLHEYVQADKIRAARIEKTLNGINSMANSNKKKIDLISAEAKTTNKLLQNLISELKDINGSITSPTVSESTAAPALNATAAKSVVTASEYKAPNYSAHAVIPGRAWLKSTDNNSIITVTEGDELPPYGRVLAIDAPSQAVITSSGIIIR